MIKKFKKLHRTLERIMILSEPGTDRNFDKCSSNLYSCHTYARETLNSEFPLPKEWLQNDVSGI